MTLTNSTVSGNRTAGEDADGRRDQRRLRRHRDADHSTVSGNSTTGDAAGGGGIYGYYVTLTNSTASGNSTAGDNSDGRRDLRRVA